MGIGLGTAVFFGGALFASSATVTTASAAIIGEKYAITILLRQAGYLLLRGRLAEVTTWFIALASTPQGRHILCQAHRVVSYVLQLHATTMHPVIFRVLLNLQDLTRVLSGPAA